VVIIIESYFKFSFALSGAILWRSRMGTNESKDARS